MNLSRTHSAQWNQPFKSPWLKQGQQTNSGPFGYKALDRIRHTAPELSFDKQSKFILFSDLHRSNRDKNDAFAANEPLFLHALKQYLADSFTYIELGDGDDLWLTSDFGQVKQAYPQVFALLKQFQQHNQLQLILGNHEIQTREQRQRVQKENFILREGLVLRYQETGQPLLVVHGHQVDLLCDRLNLITKQMTELLIKGASRFGGFGWAPTHTTYGMGKQIQKLFVQIGKQYQCLLNRSMARWASLHQQIVIYGHSHLPVFPRPGDSPSFNTGSGMNLGTITGIEIVAGMISQVAWTLDPSQQIRRQVLAGPIPLTAYG